MSSSLITTYDPEWPALFEREAALLRPIFGDFLVAIHHFGSTSVPGLTAKPVIDILPVVRDIALVEGCSGALEALGYEVRGEYGIPGRRYFVRKSPYRVHMHVFGQDDQHQIDRHLAVRDYLRTHPEVAAAYAALKVELNERFGADIEAYVSGKDAFVKQLERDALTWYRSRR